MNQTATDTAAIGAIEFRSVRKSYGSVDAVSDVDLSIRPGEFVSLLGPSGSGKSTLLMLLAGFEQPSAGEISVDGKSLANVPPNRRDQGIVFQNYALFPHMTVRQNLEFPLRARGITGARADRAVLTALEQVRMAAMIDRYPGQLSGGQQQRIALARAIVFDPPIILMDEALSALDRKLRHEMCFEIKTLHRELGKTIVYVTHDQEEAMTMSDRIVVLSNGGIAQVGTPSEIFDEPANAYVAGFVGEANFLDGTVLSRDGQRATLKTPLGEIEGICAQDVAPGAAATAMVRPESVRFARQGAEAGAVRLTGEVLDVAFLGGSHHYQIRCGEQVLIATVPRDRGERGHAHGETVALSFTPEHVRVFEL